MIAEAGWEPITNAVTDSDSVYIERFGNAYFTLMNDSNDEIDATIAIEADQIPNSVKVTDLISGESFDVSPENDVIKIKVSMQPEQVRLLVFIIGG